jgi:hypothetical protein
MKSHIFSAVFFIIFGHQDPGSGSGSVFQPKMPDPDPDPDSMNPDPKRWKTVEVLRIPDFLRHTTD